MQQREPMLTPREVADELSIHPNTVSRFIREGKLRAVGLGRGWRIRREDLDAFLEARTSTGPLPVVDVEPAAS